MLTSPIVYEHLKSFENEAWKDYVSQDHKPEIEFTPNRAGAAANDKIRVTFGKRQRKAA